MCLHDEENRIERDNDQVDLERSMFISNPEMWKELYGKDLAPEGPGTIIRYPTSEEDFEEMIREWTEDGYTPEVS
jgi:predicted ATPase